MVAFFLFLPPFNYTKNTYPTFPNHTTPLEKRDRVHVNFYNKPDGMKKIYHSSICVHLRSSAVSKKRKHPLCDKEPSLRPKKSKSN